MMKFYQLIDDLRQTEKTIAVLDNAISVLTKSKEKEMNKLEEIERDLEEERVKELIGLEAFEQIMENYHPDNDLFIYNQP